MTDKNNDGTHTASDEMDFSDLLRIIWRGKWFIMLVTAVFAVLSVLYSLSLANVYKSEAVLTPATEKSGLNIPGQLGGLAAMAGLNLGGSGATDNTALGLELIKSRDFIGRFVERHNLLVPLMATSGWDRGSNALLFDPELYDVQSKAWVRKVNPPFQPEPSLLEAHDAFMDNFSISQDKLTKMIKVSLEHYSPELAAQWLSLLIKDINEEIRQRDLREAERSIVYLNKQIEETNIADVKATLFSLVEEQMKTKMLANVRSEYVFKTIDPPVVPEMKAKPMRALIVVASVILGFMFSCLIVLFRHVYKSGRP
ncbi:Wzz/FepE/Etk N-terminal domain-containing protein [Rheinheimera sp.]|jgi:uncharacterized protein involved in exopolysaccharide biosynthesis|uniref:Wzz/FepE/Etk N-terminal domain-containing protein n=1 Tax=Rheinheimera sp. TaxID=1869214 RepID=UPI0026081D3C|nr:Wzz/FepE/Etk N-terminal domain-containing protein [Rheinheimera sp.]MCA1929392.1 LPS O-antigen length regulator [Rheinheimera sp.]